MFKAGLIKQNILFIFDGGAFFIFSIINIVGMDLMLLLPNIGKTFENRRTGTSGRIVRSD